MESIWPQDYALIEFAVCLSEADILKAAHIGINEAVENRFETVLKDVGSNPSIERLLTSLARLGLATALNEALDRRFPSHYPDDFTEDDLSNVIAFPPRG